MKSLVFRLLGLAVLALSACTMPVPRPSDAQLQQLWQVHAAAVQPVSHWDLRGRLAVRVDDRGGQATLSWQRDADRHAIRLNGPFGQGAVRITHDGEGAVLQDAQGRTLTAANAEQLVALYTGWQLPLASLEWWLLGLPVPDRAAERELDEAGRLRDLHQLDWTVHYEAYRSVSGLSLPSRITLRRQAGESAPGMEARFVIDQWAQVK